MQNLVEIQFFEIHMFHELFENPSDFLFPSPETTCPCFALPCVPGSNEPDKRFPVPLASGSVQSIVDPNRRWEGDNEVKSVCSFPQLPAHVPYSVTAPLKAATSSEFYSSFFYLTILKAETYRLSTSPP